MIGSERKSGAATLQREAAAGRDQPGTERRKNTLDQGDHHAAAVGCAQVRRIAAPDRDITVGVVCAGARIVDQAAAFGRVGLAGKRRDRYFGGGGIGVVPRAILEREFFRFDKRMPVVRRVAIQLVRAVGFEDVQDLQDGHALPVRRQLEHIIAAVIRRDRFDPVTAGCGKIIDAEKTAGRAHAGAQPFRELTIIEPVTAALRDQGVGVGKIRIDMRLTRDRCPPLADKRIGERRCKPVELRITEDACGSRRPHIGGARTNRNAIARVIDDRREYVIEIESAEAFVQGAPAIDSTRARYRERATPRDHAGRANRIAERCVTQFARRAAARVQAVQRLLRRVPHDREQITTGSAHMWFRQAEHRVCGNCRVDGAAAPLQHGESGLRRERLARRDHAFAPVARAARSDVHRIQFLISIFRPSAAGRSSPACTSSTAASRACAAAGIGALRRSANAMCTNSISAVAARYPRSRW